MKRLLKTTAALGLALCAGAAGANACDSLGQFEWLLGTWNADGDRSTWRESWIPIAPGTWDGRGVETSKTDPARQSAESLRLVEMGGGVFYVAKVAHNDLPVAFRLTRCEARHLVFENPAHDFPRRLEYQLQPDGRLRLHVSDGGDKGFTLEFEREPAADDDSAAVLAAEDARFVAMVAADGAALRAALAEDLAYIHMTGDVEDREAFVAAIENGARRYLAIEPGERQVDVLRPDVALVRGRGRFLAEGGGKRFDFQSRYLAVYRRVDGAWRLRAWQSLRLP